MAEIVLSYYQRLRHWWLQRDLRRYEDGRNGTPGVMLKTGELIDIVRVDGFAWISHDGKRFSARDIQAAGSLKWLYRMYC